MGDFVEKLTRVTIANSSSMVRHSRTAPCAPASEHQKRLFRNLILFRWPLSRSTPAPSAQLNGGCAFLGDYSIFNGVTLSDCSSALDGGGMYLVGVNRGAPSSANILRGLTVNRARSDGVRSCSCGARDRTSPGVSFEVIRMRSPNSTFNPRLTSPHVARRRHFLEHEWQPRQRCHVQYALPGAPSSNLANPCSPRRDSHLPR